VDTVLWLHVVATHSTVVNCSMPAHLQYSDDDEC